MTANLREFARLGGIATISIVCIPNITSPVERPTKSARSFYKKPGKLAAHLAHQWMDLYDRGHKLFPTITGLASLANIYVFWSLRTIPGQASTKWTCNWPGQYLFAASTAMAIVPWTVLTMIKTNKALDSYAEDEDEPDAGPEDIKDVALSTEEVGKLALADEQVPKLLKKWARLNMVRAIFPFLGALISLHASSTSLSQ